MQLKSWNFELLMSESYNISQSFELRNHVLLINLIFFLANNSDHFVCNNQDEMSFFLYWMWNFSNSFSCAYKRFDSFWMIYYFHESEMIDLLKEINIRLKWEEFESIIV